MLDLMLPPRCLTCEAPVREQGQLCGKCFGRISFIVDPVCTRCGVPFSSGPNRVCPDCETSPPVFGCARGALRYDLAGRELLLPFKHADRTDLAQVLARHMARAGAALIESADVLVAVPLHRRRLFRRRYNQAALLARSITRLSGKPALLDALVRTLPTPALEQKSAAERELAVGNAFAFRRARSVEGRRVLLIDDVMTSGATTNACARVLLAAGAVGVDVLVAARVPSPRGGP
jgi:ComF family protein